MFKSWSNFWSSIASLDQVSSRSQNDRQSPSLSLETVTISRAHFFDPLHDTERLGESLSYIFDPCWDSDARHFFEDLTSSSIHYDLSRPYQRKLDVWQDALETRDIRRRWTPCHESKFHDYPVVSRASTSESFKYSTSSSTTRHRRHTYTCVKWYVGFFVVGFELCFISWDVETIDVWSILSSYISRLLQKIKTITNIVDSHHTGFYQTKQIRQVMRFKRMSRNDSIIELLSWSLKFLSILFRKYWNQEVRFLVSTLIRSPWDSRIHDNLTSIVSSSRDHFCNFSSRFTRVGKYPIHFHQWN